MHFTNLLLVLSAAAATAATAVSPDRPGAILRSEAPPGNIIQEFDPSDLSAIDEHLASEPAPAGLTKRSDCKGSALCGSGTKGGNCIAALNGYDDNTLYCGYTSRVSGHCGAMFTCNNFNGHCWWGFWVKDFFRKIYSEVGCGVCGTYTVPDNLGGFQMYGCRATFNYVS